MYSWLSEMQTIFLESWFFNDLKIFVSIFIISNFFLCFYVGWARSLYFMNIIFTCLNIFVFGVLLYLCRLHAVAYASEIIKIPTIGLAIMKTKWTKGQLERFFEIYEKEFENFKEEFENAILFSDYEKKNLIEKSINPTDLKENMLSEILEALKTTEESGADVVLECLSYFFLCVKSMYFFALPSEWILLYSKEIFLPETVEQVILDGNLSLFDIAFDVGLYGTRYAIATFIVGGIG